MNYLKLNLCLFLVLAFLELYYQQDTTDQDQPSSTSPSVVATTIAMAPNDTMKLNSTQIIANIIQLVKGNPEFWYDNEDVGYFSMGQIPADYEGED